MLNEAFSFLISTKPLQNNLRGRNCRWQMIFKIAAPKDFTIFTGKHLYWSLFLITLQAYYDVIVLFNSVQEGRAHLKINKFELTYFMNGPF